MSSKKFKDLVIAESGVRLPAEVANRVPYLDASKELQSSNVTDTELSYIEGLDSNAQDQIDAANQAAADAQADIDNHIADSSDAHDASAISSVPSGNLAATDVQAALNELQSDIDSRALDSAVIKKDGSVAFTADQSMGGNQLTNVGAPSAGTDAATKAYVDSVAEGLKPKMAVRAATTANIDLSADLEDADVLDGVTLATGDRVLVKDQTAPEENGIYIVVASGAASRSSDFDSLTPIDEINGAYVPVQEGTANAGKFFVQSGLVAVLDTDPINFVFFNSAATLSGGDGITISSNIVSVDHDGNGLTFVSNQLALELDGTTLAKGASGLKLNDTAVSPGSYGSATQTVSLTVDQQGRLTAASHQSIAIPASQVTDFNEAAQDAVGTILVDSASVDFTYNDGTPSITAAVLPGGVNHDALLNFVANKHIDHSAVNINTASNSGLSGGGDITASRSLVIDPNNAPSVSAASGDLLLIADVSDSNNLKKVTAQSIADLASSGSPDDISETSFAAANNVSSPASVTGLAFANANVRAFEALVSVTLDATADAYEVFKLYGVQKGASWDMSVESTGDDSGVIFSINSSGQVLYISQNSAGFVSNTIKFRAMTLAV